MYKTIVGIDNGVTGTIGVINGRSGTTFVPVPVVKQQDYTKKKKNVTRIDGPKLIGFFKEQVKFNQDTICLVERPMINPTRFAASISAVRALESTLTIMEAMELPYKYIDSKEWQRKMLPKGVKGNELKKASHDIGIRLFPQFKELISKHKDADGILIAEYGRQYIS